MLHNSGMNNSNYEYVCYSKTAMTLLDEALKANAKLSVELATERTKRTDLEKQLKELQDKLKESAKN